MHDAVGVWTSCFMLLFVLAGAALLWMHFSIRRMERKAAAEQLDSLPELPEMIELHESHHKDATGLGAHRRRKDTGVRNPASANTNSAS